MNAIEEYEHEGATVELFYDEDPMSPREWDQLGTIVTWGREGGWGDEALRFEPYDTDYTTARWAVRARRERGALVVFPLRFSDYGSSGCDLSICDNWDDANAVIFDTPKGRENTGVVATRDEIDSQLRGEVEEMATYLRGEVYGFVVEKCGRILDSCWGFLGDDGLKEARNMAESAAEDEARDHAQLAAYEVAH